MKNYAFPSTIAVLSILATSTLAQKPEAGQFSAEKYAIQSTRGHRVKMADGVQLSVDVYRPMTSERVPGILIHTPYNNNSPSWTTRSRWFAARGYAVAVSDTRGRFDSEGDWDPFDRKHKTDGAELVEWLARQ